MEQRNMTDRFMRLNYRQKKTMPPGDPRMRVTPKHSESAFAPFPRSTWIHPHAPHDDFDRVCKVIWSRAKEAEECGRGQSTSETPLDDEPSHR